jgi:indolepyruvate ferredoxin oxidoreductase
MPLKLLARAKFLRATPFDPFGYTAERRGERELIAWYEQQIDMILAKLNAKTHPENLPDLVAIARAPLEIRGYGPVKDAAIPKAKAEVKRLWERLA